MTKRLKEDLKKLGEWKTSAPTQTKLEDFEKWAILHGFDITKWSNGNYKSGPTVYALACWQEQQKEIDALKADNASLYESLNAEAKERCRLEDENAALKAENRGLADLYQKKVEDCAETEVRMHRQIETLKAENERLRKDAERYQWLKQNPDVWIQVDNRKGKTIYRVVSDGEASGTRRQSYDNALDAAMKEAK